MAYKKEKAAVSQIMLDVVPSDIFVVNESHYRPYIESFMHAPVNFTQQQMGTLFGLFYITDFSEDSAHIVNFLTSETKKEYFASTKRDITTALESALHRINCALAEVAKHGNIGWLGKVDAAVCVIDRETIYFSVSGDARVLLLREGSLIDISEGLASDEAAEHPLKTFVDIASGDLEKDDVVIVTTPELLSLFTIEELTKYAERLDQESFIRFLNTALVNECDVAAAFVLHAQEITDKKSAIVHAPESEITDDGESPEIIANFFSAKTFDGKYAPANRATKHDTHRNTAIDAALEDLDSVDSDIDPTRDVYTDKRTGHIYIDGDEKHTGHSSALSPAFGKVHDLYDDMRYGTKSRMRSWGTSCKNFFVAAGAWIAVKVRGTARDIGGPGDTVADAVENFSQDQTTPQPKDASIQNSVHAVLNDTNQAGGTKTRSTNPSPEGHPKSGAIKDFFAANSASTKNITSDSSAVVGKMISTIIAGCQKKIRALTGALRNVFSGTHNREKRSESVITFFRDVMMHDKKILIIGVLALLALPLLLRPLFSGESEAPVAEVPVAIVEPVAPVMTATIDDGRFLIEEDNIVRHVTRGNGTNVLGVSGETVWVVNSTDGTSESFTLPNSETIAHTTFMDELNLLFLYTDTGKLYTFSSIDKKFEEGTPSDFPKSASAIAAFSTFLYALDPETNQLYRYPRSETATGFGAQVEWFDDGEAPNAKRFSAMSINENLYLAEDSDIVVYANRKKSPIDFVLDEGFTPDLMYSDDNSENIAILSKEKSQIVRYTKTGARVDDIIHPDFENALSFVINETENKLYLVTDTGLQEFRL